MKSKGKNIDKVYIQAKEYLQGIEDAELPQYILIYDFEILLPEGSETEVLHL